MGRGSEWLQRAGGEGVGRGEGADGDTRRPWLAAESTGWNKADLTRLPLGGGRVTVGPSPSSYRAVLHVGLVGGWGGRGADVARPSRLGGRLLRLA